MRRNVKASTNRNKIRPIMVELLNFKLKEAGSNLKYVLDMDELTTQSFRLSYVDKFIDNSFTTNIITTKEFDGFVRGVLLELGVEDTGYTNTVHTLIVWKEITE